MFNSIIKRPKITLMFVFILIIIGLLTLFQLPQREIPHISLNIGTISTVYPGGTPQEVEQQITIPLEEEIEGIEGVSDVSSVSTSGFSTIIIEVEDDVNQNDVFNDVQQAMLSVSGRFPDEVMTPKLSQEATLGALSSYHIFHDDREALYDLKEMLHEWQREVEAMPGVERTIVKGLPDHFFMIDVNSESLDDSGLQLPAVITALEGELTTQPLGVQRRDDKNVQLALELLENETDLGSIFVGNDMEGDPVYIEDVAEVGPMYDNVNDLITLHENEPTLSFTIIPVEDASVPQLHKQVDELMIQLAAEDLPESSDMELFYTQQTIVDDIFGDLAFSFLLAALSVIIVTLLGLNAASAIIVALAIPASVFIGLIPLPFFNVDLNQISIIGLIIALGILVDDAIVVGDNIRYHYRKGLGPIDGALKGSKEVRTSIMTSTLTIVVTFFPLVFISGSNGDFIRALPTVLIMTILASTVVALTFVPIFLIWRQKKQRRVKKKGRHAPREGLFGKQIDRLADWYSDTILRKVVRHPWKVAIVGFIITTGFYALIPFIPVEFFPSTDRDEVTIEVRLPAGTPIDETEDLLRQMRDVIVASDEHIYETAIYAGDGLPPLFGSGIDNSNEETGHLLLRTNREEQSAEQTMTRWTEELQERFSEAEIELTTIEAGPPVGAPIAVKLQGPDVETLMNMSEELQMEIEALPNSGTVLDDMGPKRPTVVYLPVREELEENGLTMSDISEQIALRTEGVPLMTFRTGEDAISIFMSVDRADDNTLPNLSEIDIPVQSQVNDALPETVTLDRLVNLAETEEIPQILREEGRRTVNVRVYPAGGNDEGLEEAIEAIGAEVESRAGADYSVAVGGETEARTDFIIELFTLFLVVLFLIYIIMAIQFYSLSIPLLVMSTVYIAGAGAMAGLFLTRTGLGFMALMGIVSLAGIVVRNSIVLLEFIKQRRQDGMPTEEAVVEAGRVRLRPILLTAFTAIGALTPVALSGDVLFGPLAISIISGLLFSALITIILVPAIYTAFATKFGKI
ncbi:efflux RND transporter permease subunit [Salipaludibacillus sp. LMS25]|jgi:multidrug efflux pump subunit AcrB|uniref:efflux RND transporter permease subunit n=1 Tax=Salipaludibacillus sp. LMS25 TaxID=2924031 RepID=UPI0020D09327|nr:efflux RND transporter permease subunit [Salipaludibacillus sp. LMS25]UTR13321.1 efflux RND transporter permease subunit [Salipaludibacillus sp. LMS25]